VGDATDERERPGRGAVLELDGVRKRHRRRGPWVLDGVELVVHPGQVVVVHGGNGSGKSTLVRVAAGLSRPSAGLRDRRGTASYLPERPPAAPPMVVRSYLAHLARIAGCPAADVDGSLERHGLVAVADRPVADLSKGWAQRVGLAGALLGDPDLVLLDEPWSGVDEAGVAGMVERIEVHRRAGGAFLITSHDPVRVDDPVRLLLRAGKLHRITEEPPRTSEPDRRSRGGRADGQEHARSARARVVVLAPGSTAVPLLGADELASLPGVVSLGADPGGAVHVAVEDPHVDTFVLRALNGGWSLRALHEPADEELAPEEPAP
jgi:ABC-type Mn2+/Zn2+ transport system ATPase subunit